MLLRTKHFGEIDCDGSAVITFEEGLPGFSDSQYVLLADNPNDMFCWLQSVEDEDLAFVLMDVKQVMPGYNPQIDTEMLESLGDGSGSVSLSELSCYNIAVVPDDLQKLRVNLKAPILINTATRKGKQVIASNEDYVVRHYIFEEIETHHRQVM